jgi:hypothetical protein
MASMPLAWHESCLKNMTDSLQDKIKQLDQMQAEINRLSCDRLHYLDQVNEAKRRKLDKFDSERFMKGSK